MATVDELLAGVSTVDKTLVISNDFRTINIPSSVPNLGVENDDDVLRLDFKMPRYVSDTDLSEFSIRINYMNAQRETDVYTVRDKAVGSQYITFSWLVGPTATRYKGNTKFIVCAKIADGDGVIEKEFNTTIATLPVLEGLEVDEAIVTDYSDVIEQWRRELFGIGDTEEASIRAAGQKELEAIDAEGERVLGTIPPDYRTAVSMTDNADRTKADAIVCSVEGESIIVTDSSDDYLRGLKVFGDTTQVTTTGRNLLDVDEHLSFTYIHGKEVHIPAGTYILTFESETHGGDYAPYVCFKTNNVGVLVTTPGKQYPITLTTDETQLYIYANNYSAAGSEGISATINKLMLSVDGGEYEPYSGGVASPRPSWPQPLTNINSPTINIYGKNLLKLVASNQTTNGVTFTINADNSISIKGTATASVYYGLNYNVMTLIPGETYIMTGGLAGSSGTTYRLYAQTIDGKKFYADYGNGVSFKATDEQWQVLFAVYKGTTVDFTIYPELRLKSVTNPVFEPYMDQSNITVPYSLSAVPVDQNGNRIDLTGQQWICDEIDFRRGLYIKRIGTKVYDGSTDENWHDELVLDNTVMFRMEISDSVNVGNVVGKDYLCSNFPVKNMYNSDVEGTQHTMKQFYFRLNKSTLTTVDQDGFRNYLAAHPMTVQYVLATPIETKITPEEIAWFRFAHTNFPTTTVLNDAGATIELEYNADTKLWLDNAPKVTDEQAGPLVEAWMDEHFLNAEGVVYGRSAYEIAVEQGFQGSEEYWLATLKGRDGKDGKDGETGAPGADGYVPVKGTDYFTEADKEELVENVTENVVDTLKSGESITIDDHIIEQGVTTTQGVTWTWRKWASGVAEIWSIIGNNIPKNDFITLPFKMYDPNMNWDRPIVTYSVSGISHLFVPSDNSDHGFDYDIEFDEETESDVIGDTLWSPQLSVYELVEGSINYLHDFSNYTLDVHMLGRWKPLE